MNLLLTPAKFMAIAVYLEQLHNPVLFGTDSGNYPAGDSGGIRHPFRPISGRFLMFSGMGAG